MNFPSLGNLHNAVLKCYSDAPLGNLRSGNSTGDYVIFLEGENDESCLLVWKTKTLYLVVRSTVSAEACAMTEALDTAHFISKVLSEILFNEPINAKVVQHRIPIKAYTDNESLYRNTHSTTMASEHRLRIELAIIKQMLEKNELHTFEWTPATQQPADCLTKQGASSLNLARAIQNGRISY